MIPDAIPERIKNKGPAFVGWWKLYVALVERYYLGKKGQKALAGDAGVSPPTITSIRKGDKACDFPVQKSITEAIVKNHADDPDAMALIALLYSAGQPHPEKRAPERYNRTDDMVKALHRIANICDRIETRMEKIERVLPPLVAVEKPSGQDG